MRVKLIDVDNRLDIKYTKNDEIYQFGSDNAYPSLIKSLIHNLNFNRRIYLKQFSSYFYLNKIRNWEKGKECEVELVKIPAPEND